MLSNFGGWAGVYAFAFRLVLPDLLLAPGEPDEGRVLPFGHAQFFGEQLRYLPGRTASPGLQLLNRKGAAAYPVRKVELREVEVFAALLEPLAKCKPTVQRQSTSLRWS